VNRGRKLSSHKVITALWKGENLPRHSNDVYGPEYVENLAQGVQEHIPDSELLVLTDAHYWHRLSDSSARVLALDGYGVGGWSNILEMFRPDLWPCAGERMLGMGLDTVIVGDCSWLWEWDESPVGLPLDPYYAPLPCNGVMTWDREGAQLVWEAFLESRRARMARHLYARRPSEMALLRDLYARLGWVPLEHTHRRLLSYKVHVKNGMPVEDASIVYFHGSPTPADLPESDPIRQCWSSLKNVS